MNMKKPIAAGTVVCLAFFVGLFLVLSSQAKGSASDTVSAITQLENESVKADLANDTSWAKTNLADNFISGSSFGEWETKAAQLKDAEDLTKNKINSESTSNLKVKAYGDSAIARYSETYDSLYHGEHRARTVICTDSWAKQAGAWKEVASHCSQTK
jgi:Domain of unknown function (DUF4440)